MKRLKLKIQTTRRYCPVTTLTCNQSCVGSRCVRTILIGKLSQIIKRIQTDHELNDVLWNSFYDGE